MQKPQHAGMLLALALIMSSGVPRAGAQGLPNPYRIVEDWAKLPNGRPMGAAGKVAIDPDGQHVWAVVRCERL